VAPRFGGIWKLLHFFFFFSFLFLFFFFFFLVFFLFPRRGRGTFPAYSVQPLLFLLFLFFSVRSVEVRPPPPTHRSTVFVLFLFPPEINLNFQFSFFSPSFCDKLASLNAFFFFACSLCQIAEMIPFFFPPQPFSEHRVGFAFSSRPQCKWPLPSPPLFCLSVG